MVLAPINAPLASFSNVSFLLPGAGSVRLMLITCGGGGATGVSDFFQPGVSDFLPQGVAGYASGDELLHVEWFDLDLPDEALARADGGETVLRRAPEGDRPGGADAAMEGQALAARPIEVGDGEKNERHPLGPWSFGPQGRHDASV